MSYKEIQDVGRGRGGSVGFVYISILISPGEREAWFVQMRQKV